MMSKCAQLLFQARNLGFKLHDVPAGYRPKSLNEAYAFQADLERMFNSKRIGYKAANTNQSSQEFLNLHEPFFGPLLDSPLVGAVGTPNLPARINIKKLNLRLCEPEIALQVGNEGEIVAVAPAMEIVHSSFLEWKHTNVGAFSLIADLACNGAWVRGEAVPMSNNNVDLDNIECTFKVNGVLACKGHSSKVRPLHVYKQLLERFKPQPGDWITTGVICDPPYRYGARGDVLQVDFTQGVGSVALELE